MFWYSLNKKQRGFTLTELIVTIAVLGVLAAIAIPGFSGWLPKYRLKRAARDLYSNMQLAKLEAIKRNQNCTIKLSKAPDQYRIECLDKTVSLGEYKGGVKFQGPSGETSDATITFSSRGLCNIANVYLSNDRNNGHYRIRTSSSGAVKLERWNGSHWD